MNMEAEYIDRPGTPADLAQAKLLAKSVITRFFADMHPDKQITPIDLQNADALLFILWKRGIKLTGPQS